ncbi:hypothetical protein [Xylocopilactobacillus apicola]|uniref:Uncharacterized protein n=1 Tax=Xylocopilactobacillus apicola TaxID=2932184 RepID=A0AAU9CWA9_9LACO|nr:hypothetical protein [Xylocopilactobacillus apicola]BDR58267.1 hypothetical protein XA3_07080 [Xylocopilactobacillus apicola]
MGINFFKNDKENKLEQDYQRMLGVPTVKLIPQSEQAALNILVDSLLTPNDRLVIISSENKNLNCKFRFLLDHYQTEYCQKTFEHLELESLQSQIEKFGPQVIIFDRASFQFKPDWQGLRHLARINGSQLVVMMNSSIDCELAEVVNLADFVTAKWGAGMIISQFDYQALIEESRDKFFSKEVIFSSNIVNSKIANLNAQALRRGIGSQASCNGALVCLPYSEMPDRIENFQKILHQVGLEVKEANLKSEKQKVLFFSTYDLTASGYSQEACQQIGAIISKAFFVQKNLIKLEELRQQVLNIQRDYL